MAKKFMDNGDYVPDDITIRMVLSWIDEPEHSGGFILDGFPRTVGQAKALIRHLGTGYGVDWVYECSGSPVATTLSINLVKKQGTIMQIGLHGNSFDFDFLEAELKEITIKTSFAGSLDAWDRTMILLDQGKIDLAPLVSDVFTMTEWEKAFEKIFKKEGIKIMLEPN